MEKLLAPLLHQQSALAMLNEGKTAFIPPDVRLAVLHFRDLRWKSKLFMLYCSMFEVAVLIVGLTSVLVLSILLQFEA